MRHLIGLAGALLAALTAGPAAADYVVLKNGQRLRGEVIARGETGVDLQLPSLSTTIPHDDIATIETEKPEAYFEEEATRLLKRSYWDQAAKFLERGLEKCPDHAPLKTLAAATAKLRAALDAVDQMDLAKAETLAAAAVDIAPQIDRFARELKRISQAKGYAAEHGSLPGDFRELTEGRVIIRHHHPAKAAAWAKQATELIPEVVRRVRRARAHKIPAESRLVISVYRTADAYEAGTVKARPYGRLAGTNAARMTSSTTAATYMDAADDWIPAIVERFVVTQMYEFTPLWLREGLVGGGNVKDNEMVLRDAAAELLEGEQLLALEELLRVGHYEQFDDMISRNRFRSQAAAFTRYVCGFGNGLRETSRAITKSRNMVLYALLDPRKKQRRLKSYRFEDLVPIFLTRQLPERFGLKDLPTMEKDFGEWIATGKRKGRKR